MINVVNDFILYRQILLPAYFLNGTSFGAITGPTLSRVTSLCSSKHKFNIENYFQRSFAEIRSVICHLQGTWFFITSTENHKINWISTASWNFILRMLQRRWILSTSKNLISVMKWKYYRKYHFVWYFTCNNYYSTRFFHPNRWSSDYSTNLNSIVICGFTSYKELKEIRQYQ